MKTQSLLLDRRPPTMDSILEAIKALPTTRQALEVNVKLLKSNGLRPFPSDFAVWDKHLSPEFERWLLKFIEDSRHICDVNI
jgi:hypothetical protein